MKKLNKYYFEKRLKAGYTGFQVICWYYFKDKKGITQQAIAAKHYFDLDCYKDKITKEMKDLLIGVIIKKISTLYRISM